MLTTASYRALSRFAPLLAVYVSVRVWQGVGATAQAHPDSPGYRAAASLLGHAGRPWGVPAFYALFPDDGWRVVGQWLVATCAWSLLAWAMWRLPRSTAAKLVASAMTFGLALVPTVSAWDVAVLSESLSLSLGAGTLGCLLLWRESGSRLALIAAVPVGIWWAFTRSDLIILFAALVAGVAWIAFRNSGHRRTVVTVVLVLTAGLAWIWFSNANIERHARHPYSAGGAYVEELAVYRLGLNVYPDPAVERVFTERLGLPACPGLAEQARRRWDVTAIPAEYRKCPELASWVKGGASTVGLRFAAAAPASFARTGAPMLAVMQYGMHPTPATTALPVRVLNLAFFPALKWAPLLMPLQLLLIVLGLALGAWRSHRREVLIACSLVAAAAASQLATLLLAVSSLPRLGVQEAVLTRVAGVVLIAVAVDLIVLRRKGVVAA